MEKEFFRIDTKGLCLFCLKDNYYNNNDARFGSNSTVSVSFKMLLRYLKINVYEICNFSPTFLQSMDAMEDTEVITTICPDCTEVMKKFSKLYQDMEVIRLQLDKCVQSLYCAMQNGENNKSRADEYRRRMQTRNLMEMFQANVADSLRHETMRKCSIRVEALTPRVTLNRRAVDTFQLPVIKSTVSTAPLEATSTSDSKFSRYDLEPPHLLPEVTLNPNPNLNDFNNEHGTGNPPDLSFNGDNLIDYSEDFVVKVEPVIDELSRRMDSDDNTNCDKDENDIFLDYRRKDDPDQGQCQSQDYVAPKRRPGRKSKYMNYSFPSDQLLRELLDETEVKPSVSGGIWADPVGGSGFRCEVCGKKFKAARSLWGHLKIHKSRSSPVSSSSPPNNPVTNPAPVTITTTVKMGKSKKRKIKRRSKCNICGASFANLSAFRSHMKKHQNQTNDGKGNCSTTPIKGETSTSTLRRRFTCVYCDKVFHSYTIYRTHLVSLHTLQEFSHRLPSGTTEEELTAVIKEAIDNHKPLPPTGSRKKYHYGCNLCNGEYPHPSHLRLHFLRSHFDNLRERLETFKSGCDYHGRDHQDYNGDDNGDGDDGDEVNVHDRSGASEEFDQLMNQQQGDDDDLKLEHEFNARDIGNDNDDDDFDLDHESNADDIGKGNDNVDSNEEIGEEEEEDELDSSSLFVVQGQVFPSEADPLNTIND